MILYFTNQSRITPEDVKRWLPERFDANPQKRECTGVDGHSGQVFCRDAKFCRFDAGTQVWHSMGQVQKNPNSDETSELWCGWEKNKPPTPESLLRSDPLPGHQVVLGGQSWMIPQAREWAFENGRTLYDIALPKSAKYDPAEKVWHSGDVIEKYRRLYDLAQAVYDRYTDRDERTDSFNLPENPLGVCAEVLAANYFIGPEEMSAMGLVEFNFQSAWSILRLVIDEPGIIEVYQKKRDFEGS
jgi:hypothetical protein